MNRKHGFFQAVARNGTAGFAVLLLAVMFAAGGCDNGTTSDPTVTYTGIAGSSTYTLIITNDTTFVLTVDGKTSSGSAVKNGETYTLTPAGVTVTFTVTVSGDNIRAMSGTITFSDKTTAAAPAILTPPTTGGSAEIVGKWLLSGGTGDYEGLTLDFKSNGVLITYSPNSENWNMTLNYTYNGTSLTVSDGTGSAAGTAILSSAGTLTLSGFDGSGAPLKDGTYTKQQ
ncbi:MAG: hypothetical protein LBL64_09140 [Treponema sp.]|jgi:hypothetical protein|nr:hypothetical protein [Treponema sp.]